MIGGCLAVIAMIAAFVGMLVVFVQQPTSILIMVPIFFLFRSLWRKERRYMDKAIAQETQAQEDEDYYEALIDFHRGEARPQGVVRDLSDMPEPGHSLRTARMGIIPSDEVPF